MDKEFNFISKSPAQTAAFGKKLAELLPIPALVLLKGDLGTGKTLIIKAAVKELGYQGEVTSPTFNLVQEYSAEPEIIHMDLYRLNQRQELLEIGFEDYLDREAVVFIEWPELALSLLPADFIFINLEKISPAERRITAAGEGEKCRRLIERLNKEC